MRKKNLSVKVAALAMSGTLAMAPMTVRAEETTATAITEASTASTPAAAPAAAGSSATAPVTVAEAPADPATTVPNNVDTVVPDDNKQGTDIKANASAKLGFSPYL